MSGGFINIYLVYEKDLLIEKELLTLISSINNKYPIILKYSEDELGENWINKKVEYNQLKELLINLNDYYYLEIDIKNSFFNIEVDNYSINLFKNKEYNALRISIPSDKLFDNKDKQRDPIVLSDEIIKIMTNIYKNIKYSYAVCGHEIEVDYSLSEFKKQIEAGYWEYNSICILPDINKLKIYKGQYGIDGISNQNKEIINISLQ